MFNYSAFLHAYNELHTKLQGVEPKSKGWVGKVYSKNKDKDHTGAYEAYRKVKDAEHPFKSDEEVNFLKEFCELVSE